MKNKILKHSAISVTLILIASIIFASLACLPAKGTVFNESDTNNVAVESGNFVKSASNDGDVILENKVVFEDSKHFAIKSQQTLEEFLSPTSIISKIGLVTTDFVIANSLNVDKILGKDRIINGNGYTITINNSISMQPQHQSIATNPELNYLYSYYGGIVGINNGTIKNMKVNYNATDTINQTIAAASANAFAVGAVVGLNLGKINHIKVTISNTANLNATAANIDIMAGAVAGVNYGSVNNATAVLDGRLSGVTSASNNITAVGIATGLMISTTAIPSSLYNITIQGAETGKLNSSQGKVYSAASVVGFNNKHHFVDSTFKNNYIPGRINKVIHDYKGTISHSDTIVVDKFRAVGCGRIDNIYYTDSSVNTSVNYNACSVAGTPKVFANVINATKMTTSTDNPIVLIGFLSDSSIIDVSCETPVDSKIVIFDISKEFRTAVKGTDNNITIDAAATKVSTIVKYNDSIKVSNNHSKHSISASMDTDSASEFSNKFSTYNINYGGLGTVNFTEDIDHKYSGEIKGVAKFIDDNNSAYVVDEKSFTVKGKIAGLSDFVDNYNMFITPGTYDKLRIEMSNTTVDNTIVDNSGIAYVDHARKLIFPIIDRNFDNPYKIEYADMEISARDINGDLIPITDKKFRNHYSLDFSLKSKFATGAIDDIRYTSSNGTDNFGATSGVFNKGDFGKIGLNYSFVGMKDGMVVTKPITRHFMLDTIAPEVDLQFDDMTMWSGASTTTIRGVATDSNTDNLIALLMLDGMIIDTTKVLADGSFSFDITDSGDRLIQIEIADDAGNFEHITRRIMIDNIKPTFTNTVTSNGIEYIADTTSTGHVKFDVNINENLSGNTLFIIVNGIANEIDILDGTYSYTIKYTGEFGDDVKILLRSNSGLESIFNFGKVIISSEIIEITKDDITINGIISKPFDTFNSVIGATFSYTVAPDNITITAKYADINANNDIDIILTLSSNVSGKEYIFTGDFIKGNITKANVNYTVNDVNIVYGDIVPKLTGIATWSTNNAIIDDVFNEFNFGLSDTLLNINNLNANSSYEINVLNQEVVLSNYTVNFITGAFIVTSKEVEVLPHDNGTYDQIYTGAHFEYKPYFENKNKEFVYLQVKFYLNGVEVFEVINAGIYTFNYTIVGDIDTNNYTLKSTALDKKININKFKPAFIINDIDKTDTVKTAYNEKPKDIEFTDGSSLLAADALKIYNENLTISYLIANISGPDGDMLTAPINAGKYIVIISLKKIDGNINFEQSSITFNLDITQIKHDVSIKALEVDFDSNEHSLEISNIPSIFGRYESIGISTSKIIFCTESEYKKLTADPAYKADHAVIYLVLTQIGNIETSEENDYLNIMSGIYKYKLDVHNLNYLNSKVVYANLTIKRLLIDQILTFTKEQSFDYDGNSHTVIRPISNFGDYVSITDIRIPDGNINAGIYNFIYEINSRNLNHEGQTSTKLNMKLKINHLKFSDDEINIESIVKVYDGKSFDLSTLQLPDNAEIKLTIVGSIIPVNVGTYDLALSIIKDNYADYTMIIKYTITPKITVITFSGVEAIEVGGTILINGSYTDINGKQIDVIIDTSVVDINTEGKYNCGVSIGDKNYTVSDEQSTVAINISAKSNVGVIVGSVIGGVAGACAIAGAVIFIILKKKRKQILK